MGVTIVCIFSEFTKEKQKFVGAKRDAGADKKKTAKHKEERQAYLAYFNSLPVEDQAEIEQKAERLPCFGVNPDTETKIVAFMKSTERWQLGR